MIKLQVKIILWILIISRTFLFARKIENINSNELAAFEDFLRSQQLRHALIVGVGGQMESYKRLLANYRVQFFNTNSSAHFADLFYYGAPRAGVLVEQLKSSVIHQRVFGPEICGSCFNNTQAWLLLDTHLKGQADERRIEEQLAESNVNIDADITVAMRQPNNEPWLLYDVYRVSQRLRTPLRIELKGSWSPAQGYQLKETFKRSWQLRRRNFEQATLRGSTTLMEKPAHLEDMAYLANDWQLLQFDPMQRKNYQLMRHLERMYNLSLHISFKDSWGQLLPNGSWTGIIGEILADAADFAASPLRFVPHRMAHIQFTPELHTQFIHFIFRHPRHSQIRNIFFEPLSPQIWWCVLGLLLASTLLLRLHIRQERRLPEGHTLEPNINFVWFTMLETYLQQGPTTELFRLLSTRLLIFASCLFSFILMQFYGAFIVGSLLSAEPHYLTTLPALFGSGMALGMENVSYNYEIFANSSNQLLSDVYTQRICRPPGHNILEISQGAARIKAGGFAFHVAIDRIYRLLVPLLDESEFCQLQEISFSQPYTSSSALKKSSPFREHLAHAILHLRTSGLMQYNDRRWQVDKPDCSLVKASQAEVDLEHFAPALFTLALAMLGSLFVLLLELLLAWARKHSKK